PAAGSPLMRERGLSRRLRTIDVGLDDLRAAGRAARGTLNDAYLAALAGGLGRYHAEHGIAVGELPIALPVSLRETADPAGGNRFAGARIRLPCGEPDPVLRVQLIRARVRAARGEPALDFLGLTAPITSRLPTPVLTRLMAGYTHSIDLQASNFRGLDRPAYVAGARVDGMHVFGPAPGCGMMATLVSHEGVCSIGLTMDAAAITEPDLMSSCVREGFDELLALAATAVAR
ncbi:MAG: hypothetical protein JWN32_2867, partial [Solirubrobacterales bacterium]|nr:hypothetical protein [Solirubrobacterales bacterium]